MQDLLYAPVWLKVVSVSILSVLLASSIGFAILYVGQENMEDWILVSIASSQIAASGLTAILILMYSSRTVSVEDLDRRTTNFLGSIIPEKIKSISSTSLESVWVVSSKIIHQTPNLYSYRVSVSDNTSEMPIEINFSVLLNVKRLAIFFYASVDQLTASDLSEKLRFVIEVNEGIGYKYSVKTSYEERFGRETHLMAFRHEDIGYEFLTDSYAQLFFSNDIAMIVREFLLHKRRKIFCAL